MYIETNRKRSLGSCAVDEETFRKHMLSQGFKEPIEIRQTDDREPTDAQLSYAASLNIQIPPGSTLEDVSALISRSVDKDALQPNPELMQYAVNNCICDSLYVGKKRLYNQIFYSLKDKDKLAFFIFCVYRYCSDDRRGNLDTHPHRAVFYSIADELSQNPSYVSSVDRYNGEDLRFFGQMRIVENGDENTFAGGSANSIAYNLTCEKLKEKLGIKKRVSYTKRIDTFRGEQNYTYNGSPRQVRPATTVYFNVPIEFISKKSFKQSSVVVTIVVLLFVGLILIYGVATTIGTPGAKAEDLILNLLMLLVGIVCVALSILAMKFCKKR